MNKLTTQMLSFAVLLGAGCCLASCSSDNDADQQTTQSISNAYCIAVDKSTGEITYGKNLSYAIDYNYTKYTTNVTIAGLTLPNGTTYPSFSLDGMSFAYNSEGWKATSVANAKNTGSSVAPTVENFSMLLLDRTYNSEYVPGFSIKFDADNYSIYSSVAPFILGGTTVSTPATGDAYTTDESAYIVSFDFTAKTACITVNNARFHQRMPEGLVMDFKDIPFTFNPSSNTFTLSSADVIPYIADVPYDKTYPITNLTATVSPTTGMNLSFTCTVFTIPFNVKATVGF
jgi:hypothetical protein